MNHTKASPTPGPWVVISDSTSPGGTAIEQDGTTHDEAALIADICTDGPGMDESIAAANARLIAAAPDLLSACEFARAMEDNRRAGCHLTPNDFSLLHDRLTRAITAATA